MLQAMYNQTEHVKANKLENNARKLKLIINRQNLFASMRIIMSVFTVVLEMGWEGVKFIKVAKNQNWTNTPNMKGSVFFVQIRIQYSLCIWVW